MDVYDFNARTYDHQIGRFIQIDPMADDAGQEDFSPYHFGGNNPILNNDPSGNCWPCLVWGYRAYKAYRTYQTLQRILEVTKAPVSMKGRVVIIPMVITTDAQGRTVSVPESQAKQYQEQVEAEKTKQSQTEQATDTKKKVPNPNGKKGSEAHQEKINEAEKEMQEQGLETRREVEVKTPGGTKEKRYIDVEGRDPKTGEVKRVQVGKENKNGTPVSRERRL